MTTTAIYRKKALEAESQIRFKDAMEFWIKAINVYPYRQSRTELGRLDINRMKDNARHCFDARNEGIK